MARRAPLLLSFLLSGLLVCWSVEFGFRSVRTPQELANRAYERLWSNDIAGAASRFRQALEADPAFPYRWSDLGEALADAGQTGPADYCFRRAATLAPNSPQIALRTANFRFRTGAPRDGMALDAKILGDLSDFDPMIFRSWRQMGIEPQQMFDTGIGNNPRAARSLFAFLLTDGARPELATAWRWIESHNDATPTEARAWAAYLLRSGAPDQAAEVWTKQVALDPAEYGKTNWIDNGGFERNPIGGGFDWNFVSVPGVETAIDPSVAHSGRRSLRLDVHSAENLDFHHASELTWLPPGSYRLEGWLRTSAFSTDQGIGLRIFAPGHETELNEWTPSVSDTHDWTRTTREFTLTGHPALAEIDVVRKRSLDFDNQPHGTAWIDDVRIERVP